MRALRHFAKDLRHVPQLGWGFAARHSARLLGRSIVMTRVRGAGEFALRSDGSDAAVLRQIFLRREYDMSRYPAHQQRLAATYQSILAAGRIPVIVDAGANIGAASVWFARLFPQAHLFAIEPEPANLEVCRLNVAAYPEIEIVEGGVGASPGMVTLSNKSGDSDAFQTMRDADGAVRLYTIAELLERNTLFQLFIAKVDIEGFEADLFAANTEWIDECAAVFVEPHDWLLPGRGSSRTLQRAMAARDFDVLLLRETLAFVR